MTFLAFQSDRNLNISNIYSQNPIKLSHCKKSHILNILAKSSRSKKMDAL